MDADAETYTGYLEPEEEVGTASELRLPIVKTSRKSKAPSRQKKGPAIAVTPGLTYSPSTNRFYLKRTPAERFFSLVEKTEYCWIWRGYVDNDGYGLFIRSQEEHHGTWSRNMRRAHRFSYELEFGPIPAGKDVHHVCRNRACVNPAHLKAVDHESHHSLTWSREHRVERAVRLLLRTLLECSPQELLEDPNFAETGRRVSRYLLRHFPSEDLTSAAKWDLKKSVFPSHYTGMVVVQDIQAKGLCSHHLLAVEYKVHIGYLPQGKVLGLSKLVRLVRLCAGRASLQEDITEAIVIALEELLETRGCMVIVQGKHSCMGIRGVEDEAASAVTSSVRGYFREGGIARAEFLSLIGKRESGDLS